MRAGGRAAGGAAAAVAALLLAACQLPPAQHAPRPESPEPADLAVRPAQGPRLPQREAERQAAPARAAEPPAPPSIESEPAGAQAQVALRMEPGRVQFHGPRAWETLEIDGKSVALRRGEWAELGAGSHRVIAIAGRHIAQTDFTVPPGGEAMVPLRWRLRAPDPAAYAWIAGRSATIGSHRYVEVNPVREVQLGPFWIARRETTVEEYRRCVVDGACKAPPAGDECNYADPDRAKHPVNCVSARDAERFARWLSERDGLVHRLPTAQEWEMVARAGSSPSRESCNTCDASCDRLWRDRSRRDGWETTAPAGGLTACRGEDAVYDLVGNVSELCVDAELGYVDRGGSFSQMDTFLDPTFPSPRSADERSSSIGFRLIVEPPEMELATRSARARR